MTWKCQCGDVNKDSEMRCHGCGLEIQDEDYEIFMIKEKAPILSRPEKIEPQSGLIFNWKYHFGGLAFGVLLSLLIVGLRIAWFSSWQMDAATWKYYGSVIIIFGVFGFIFGNKFFDLIFKVIRWFHFI